VIIALYTLTIGNDIYINIVLVNLLGRPTLSSVDLLVWPQNNRFIWRGNFIAMSVFRPNNKKLFS